MLVITHILAFTAVTSYRSQQYEAIRNQCHTLKISRFGGFQWLQHTGVASMRKTCQIANHNEVTLWNWRFEHVYLYAITTAACTAYNDMRIRCASVVASLLLLRVFDHVVPLAFIRVVA